mmetsp:Transcript_17141/g.48182  ORF Transcript_17141/g.48182 Transcript_17141/m.48182 type:complete len:279 (+) Transcript_17141:589-1425(+)
MEFPHVRQIDRRQEYSRFRVPIREDPAEGQNAHRHALGSRHGEHAVGNVRMAFQMMLNAHDAVPESDRLSQRQQIALAQAKEHVRIVRRGDRVGDHLVGRTGNRQHIFQDGDAQQGDCCADQVHWTDRLLQENACKDGDRYDCQRSNEGALSGRDEFQRFCLAHIVHRHPEPAFHASEYQGTVMPIEKQNRETDGGRNEEAAECGFGRIVVAWRMIAVLLQVLDGGKVGRVHGGNRQQQAARCPCPQRQLLSLRRRLLLLLHWLTTQFGGTGERRVAV